MSDAPAAAVWADPGRKSGQVCVYGHRIPVLMVADMVWRDVGGVAAAEHTWNLTRGEVIGACWYVAVHGRKKWRRRWGRWAADNQAALWHGNYAAVAVPVEVETP